MVREVGNKWVCPICNWWIVWDKSGTDDALLQIIEHICKHIMGD